MIITLVVNIWNAFTTYVLLNGEKQQHCIYHQNESRTEPYEHNSSEIIVRFFIDNNHLNERERWFELLEGTFFNMKSFKAILFKN